MDRGRCFALLGRRHKELIGLRNCAARLSLAVDGYLGALMSGDQAKLDAAAKELVEAQVKVNEEVATP